ncbi:Uncharacterized protein APZ42_018969 [Daphnia magna]|uniref:Uncharacterized protein n=1 Tax=Daphnia magna TaxID=35525 RepID=A0A0P5PAR2_9CRUS|nr:Uncharacterized protein APZ42_018969 [Daphnia magna]
MWQVISDNLLLNSLYHETRTYGTSSKVTLKGICEHQSNGLGAVIQRVNDQPPFHPANSNPGKKK